MIELDDTIVAVSTASGAGRRGIVRLSGPQAFALVQAMCMPGGVGCAPACSAGRVPAAQDTAGAERALADLPPYTRCRRTLGLPGAVCVPAELYLMRAPASYTREDIVEIHTFGSPVLLEMLVEDLAARGARLAEPGEFTRRAFLNGRIDLAQAEGVLQVIRSRTDSELRLALRQLDGRFSQQVGQARDRLVEVCSLAELAIDFSDQDIEIAENAALARAIAHVSEMLAGLASHALRHAGGRPGIATAICGRPNAGKSSLLNALTGRSRSIVTHLPGTTRDTVEELLEIEGNLFRLADTAGTRATHDPIEQEAVRRAEQAAESADLVLYVVDRSQPPTPEDAAAYNAARGAARLAVLNKADLPPAGDAVHDSFGAADTVRVSCMTGDGIDELKRRMTAIVRAGRIDASAPDFLPTARQCAAIRAASDALQSAASAARDGLSTEFIALDLRVALDALGEVSGHTCTDAILDRIFADFCIGK